MGGSGIDWYIRPCEERELCFLVFVTKMRKDGGNVMFNRHCGKVQSEHENKGDLNLIM